MGRWHRRIEEDKSGDAVGAVREVLYQGRRIRQRLLALSDVERAQTYEFCGPAPLAIFDFQATLRVTPVVDGDRAFVEWWATFDCQPEMREEFSETLRSWFASWLQSLRGRIEGHRRLARKRLRIEPQGAHAQLSGRLWR